MKTSSRYAEPKIRFWEKILIPAVKLFPASTSIRVENYSVDTTANRLRECITALLSGAVVPSPELSAIPNWQTTLELLSFRVHPTHITTGQKRRPPIGVPLQTPNEQTPITIPLEAYSPRVVTSICLLKSLNLFPHPVIVPERAVRDLTFDSLATTFNVSFTEQPDKSWLLL